MNIFTLVIFVVAWGVSSEGSLNGIEKSGRQKGLLFYNNQGHLVKTYGIPLSHVGQNEQENLFYWSFLNTFLSPIFPTNLDRTAIAYMIPVSDAVIQQVHKDPIYQNKLLVLANKDPVVEVNPLCSGKRAQIPSPKFCSNYLNCWDGWAFEQKCPNDLLFSKEGFCDYPYNVDCGNRFLKDKPHPLCNKYVQAFRNQADCSEFFVCVSNELVRFKCPGDLFYSEYLGVCDIPERALCNVTSETTKAPTANHIALSTTGSTVTQQNTGFTSITPSSTSAPDKKGTVNKMEYNTQSWTSTRVAISRQDAIRKLKLSRMEQNNEDNKHLN